MTRGLMALLCLLMLSACGGGGSGSGGGGGGGSTTPTVVNYTPVVVDAGPAALAVGPNGYTATDIPYVSVTICAPGTNNCQTIDHVILDTGSIGLRLQAGVVNASLLSALPGETTTSGDPVGECYAFVDGYAFGSVKQADFSMGSEQVAGMPLQIIGDGGNFATVPSSCSSGGGSSLAGVQMLGGNGIIGLGVATTDCGTFCAINGGSGAATYYDCPAGGCSSIIARTASIAAPFQQLPNPVAAFATDNNGTIVSLPSVGADGVITANGMLYFGIGTQTNNALGSAQLITTDSEGDFTATYKNSNFTQNFIDSGSNLYFFTDSSIPLCQSSGFSGYYCPTSPLTIATTLTGANRMTTSTSFILYNAQTEPAPTSNAVPGLGANPNNLSFVHGFSRSFDFGLPFFFGRKIFTAIAGRNAGGVVGPYYGI